MQKPKNAANRVENLITDSGVCIREFSLHTHYHNALGGYLRSRQIQIDLGFTFRLNSPKPWTFPRRHTYSWTLSGLLLSQSPSEGAKAVSRETYYFPMQNVLNILSKTSSGVVSPTISDRASRAIRTSKARISPGCPRSKLFNAPSSAALAASKAIN